jgi:hypothetical protein
MSLFRSKEKLNKKPSKVRGHNSALNRVAGKKYHKQL